MANDNYTNLSNEELLNIIYSLKVDVGHLKRYLVNHNMTIFDELVKRTNFLDDSISINARLFCIEHNIDTHPICQRVGCNNKVIWHKPSKKFLRYCSKKCTYSDKRHWERIKNTCVNNFGVDNPGKSSVVQSKMKKTCNERYGVDYVTNLEFVQDKIRKTCENKFGVQYPLQSKTIRNIATNTCFERHGVMWYPQSKEYHKKAHKRYTNPKYPDMTFSSSWEFKVYDFLMENHIEFEYQPSILFEYEYDGKIHTYHPDFKVGDKIYEVKGDYFFRINETTNQEEMYCPYRYDDWTNDEYNNECRRFEAKHQCMIRNNVIILRNSQIKNLSVDIFA